MENDTLVLFRQFWVSLVASSTSRTADRKLVPAGKRLIDYALS
jgi:hypothetical protein